MTAWLTDKSTISVGIVAMIVTLGFWVGRLDATVERNAREIHEIKTSRDENSRILAARLDSMAQDLATIRGKLEMMTLPRR